MQLFDIPQIKTAQSILRAINHTDRQRILKFISDNPGTTVKQIYTGVNIIPSLTSGHLGILRTAKIVTFEKRKTESLYSINRDFVKNVNAALSSIVS